MIRATAPGSIMVTGEHAVVYGHRAIVAAIEQRVTVCFRPRSDGTVSISSEIAPPLEMNLEDAAAIGPYKFVLSALLLHQAGLSGAEIDITSQIDPTLGLGSSAAVTIAVLGAIYRYLNLPLDSLLAEACSIIQEIQGRGSGADLAASFLGGMIAYQAPPKPELVQLPKPPLLSLRYCGYKTPTAEVLAKIAAQMVGHEAEYDALYVEMGQTAQTAIDAAKAMNWSGFGRALLQYQLHMKRLGVCDEVLDQIIADAADTPDLLAAKISGSGLGDCVLAVGAVPEGFSIAPLAEKGLNFDD